MAEETAREITKKIKLRNHKNNVKTGLQPKEKLLKKNHAEQS